MEETWERLKLYEPLFGKWKVDFVAISYEDMAWVYLKDDYLTFAMNKLITTRKDIYLKIMDLCYKNDIKDDSSNNIWLSLFEFLLLNHLDQEYPTETIKIWQNRKNEVNKGLSRIRTLTER